MAGSTSNIVIDRGDPNGAESDIYVKTLMDFLESNSESQHMKGPRVEEEGSPRPLVLPPGPLLLYAEDTESDGSKPHSVGALCLMPLHAGTPMFRGLPDRVRKAGEIKRMIVFPEQLGKGIASKLIAEAKRLARAEMGVNYMVLETHRFLRGAQSLYKAAGYRERDVWGGYVQDESACFEKWL